MQGGTARAAVFGVSDGLVSNVALVLGMAGGASDPSIVRLAGIAGLVAGAVSMAAGELVSMQAQKELLERELEIERRALADNFDEELQELTETYESRGIEAGAARTAAEQVMSDPEVALEVHAREELGVDPNELGSPIGAAISSFGAFAVGAIVPLVPWFLTEGAAATIATIVLGLIAASTVGATLAVFTGRSRVASAARQALITAVSASVTYGIGTLVGVSV
ncbi:MAG: VIT1/CCC1 transporter family protein [Actinomycetota bacterium]|nr:VIT1/CCC1 transporter family protein [Actinomycetota bacterium]